MIQTAAASLVKYDNPVLVSRTDAKGGAGKGAAPGDKKPPVGAPKKLPPVDDKSRPKTPTQTEDILNSILPPREWEEQGQLWVQQVSSTPATRLDVINLQVCQALKNCNPIGTIRSNASKETSKRDRYLSSEKRIIRTIIWYDFMKLDDSFTK